MNIALPLSITCLLVLTNCSTREKKVAGSKPDTVSAPVAATFAPPDSVGNQHPPAARSPRWQYIKTVDGSGKPVYAATLTSASVLRFPYPYVGESTATLTIRQGKSPQVSLEASNGQFNRSFQGGSARIRFNNSAAVTYVLLAAANGRANIVFFDPAHPLIDRLKQTETVSISVRFAGQPDRTIAFKTAGLH